MRFLDTTRSMYDDASQPRRPACLHYERRTINMRHTLETNAISTLVRLRTNMFADTGIVVLAVYSEVSILCSAKSTYDIACNIITYAQHYQQSRPLSVVPRSNTITIIILIICTVVVVVQHN